VAQTKKKRRTKHRGTQAGNIEARGRTGRPTSRAQARQQAQQRSQRNKVDRANREPSWRGAFIRAGIAAGVFLVLLIVMKQKPAGAVFVAIVMFGLYVPMGYYTDRYLFERRQRKDAEAAAAAAADSKSS
jgi:UDP-N-acetylmuramyl pentapeptide phosphotransferase/UDP-N-acetylglucosamine-1-phosphate transferase